MTHYCFKMTLYLIFIYNLLLITQNNNIWTLNTIIKVKDSDNDDSLKLTNLISHVYILVDKWVKCVVIAPRQHYVMTKNTHLGLELLVDTYKENQNKRCRVIIIYWSKLWIRTQYFLSFLTSKNDFLLYEDDIWHWILIFIDKSSFITWNDQQITLNMLIKVKICLAFSFWKWIFW